MGLYKRTTLSQNSEDGHYCYDDDYYDDGYEIEERDDENMLESNTDRSYFMIGAVIVAGLIIAGAVAIFKTQIFGDAGILSSTFADLTEKATGMINKIDVTGTELTIMGFGVQARAAFGAMFF